MIMRYAQADPHFPRPFTAAAGMVVDSSIPGGAAKEAPGRIPTLGAALTEAMPGSAGAPCAPGSIADVQYPGAGPTLPASGLPTAHHERR